MRSVCFVFEYTKFLDKSCLVPIGSIFRPYCDSEEEVDGI